MKPPIEIVVSREPTEFGLSAFVADRPECSGSPIVGRGRTMFQAIGELIYQDQEAFGVKITLPEKKTYAPHE